ncbi:hypothetical protein V8G54_009899 [Vigna mungo]|uniref:Copia protein n=1 Tax=Vigna mungo TaxID=3915 RepID=A0AAQ3NXL2_VIGMU
MGKPKQTHMLAAKRVLRYVKGTADFGILFPVGRHKIDGECLELVREVLREMMIPVKTPLQLLIDNASAINLSKNPVSHGRSKHIEVRYHFLRDLVSKRRIQLVLADTFTKAMSFERFCWLRKEIGIRFLCEC